MKNRKILLGLFIVSLLSVCFLFTSCKKPKKAEPIVTFEEKYEMLFGEEQIIKIENADKYSIESNDNTIIKIEENKIKAVGLGSTEVMVIINDKIIQKTFTVVDQLKVEKFSEAIYDSVTPLKVSLLSKGEIKDYQVKVANPNIITYENNTLKAIRIGNSDIEISYQDFKETFNVTVIDQIGIEVKNIVSTNIDLMINCYNLSGRPLTSATLVSSNPEIVKVNSLRSITTLKAGTVTLTFKWEDYETTTEITVCSPVSVSYNDLMKIGEQQEIKVYTDNHEPITNFIITSNLESSIVVEDKEIKALDYGVVRLHLTIEGYEAQDIIVQVLGLTASGITTMKRNAIQYVNVDFLPVNGSCLYTVTSSNPEVVNVIENNKIKALKPGVTKITVSLPNGVTSSFDITVEELYYNIEYDLTDEDLALMPSGYIENHQKFCIDDLPLALPVLEKDKYNFLGWMINSTVTSSEEVDATNLYFEIPSTINYNIKLKAVWGVSRLEVKHDTIQVIEPTETLKLVATTYMIASNINEKLIGWRSENENIATVSDGIVTGVSEGDVLIEAYLIEKPDINMSIGVTIMNGLDQMDELLQYFVDNAIEEVIAKNITVTGYQFIYGLRLRGSVTNYLFKPYMVNEDYMTAINPTNRPGDVFPKYYICVHDTASSAETANALAHANYVKNGGGGTSWHYSVGNDGIYHQIPDNEGAYHAGDGGFSRPYQLTDTKIKGTNPHPVVTITNDGYYALDDVKTNVLAPTNNGAILTAADINDIGIRVVIQNGTYHIGTTYFNGTYLKISNGGGNCNSIGMETMVNKGSDLYLTWQTTAQLVAHLMQANNLTIDDVKPHHFFSGKNCPQTMRDNGLWENFLKLVEFEYEILTKYEGYEISFSTEYPEYINEYGRVIKQDTYSKSVSYTITVTKNNVSKSVTLWTTIPGNIRFRQVK